MIRARSALREFPANWCTGALSLPRLLERSREDKSRIPPESDTQRQDHLNETVVYSGDLVKKDEEGFLYFISRRDEMIKTSGYRVSPTEWRRSCWKLTA